MKAEDYCKMPPRDQISENRKYFWRSVSLIRSVKLQEHKQPLLQMKGNMSKRLSWTKVQGCLLAERLMQASVL